MQQLKNIPSKNWHSIMRLFTNMIIETEINIQPQNIKSNGLSKNIMQLGTYRCTEFHHCTEVMPLSGYRRPSSSSGLQRCHPRRTWWTSASSPAASSSSDLVDIGVVISVVIIVEIGRHQRRHRSHHRRSWSTSASSSASSSAESSAGLQGYRVLRQRPPGRAVDLSHPRQAAATNEVVFRV